MRELEMNVMKPKEPPCWEERTGLHEQEEQFRLLWS